MFSKSLFHGLRSDLEAMIASDQGSISQQKESRSTDQAQRERSVKIKLKIKTYFENKNNTILKSNDLAAKMKWFSSKN